MNKLIYLSKRRLGLLWLLSLIVIAGSSVLVYAAAVDSFAGKPVELDSPGVHAFAITPADATELTYVTRGLYVGVSGDVALTMLGGEAVVFTGLAAGVIHPLRVTIVASTNTNATNITGIY